MGEPTKNECQGHTQAVGGFCMAPDCKARPDAAVIESFPSVSIEREHLSRLRLMGDEEDSKWDLSPNDRAAIRYALREIENLKAEINARKGDPVTRLHNLARGLEQPLGCGHDLSDWCDNCETCGSCRDAERSASNATR